MEWIQSTEVDPEEEFIRALGGNPLVSRILQRRGFWSLEAAQGFLDPDRYLPASPYDLPGMSLGVDRLEHAIRAEEGILVWGDYDVDGQTATALLVLALRELGARVAYHVPVRQRESHGVSLPVLKENLHLGLPGAQIRVLLTCDTGISAHQAVQYACDQGIAVIITDHHELPADLPAATALINPRLLPANHPLGNLPGVGVAYKLIEALVERSAMAGKAETYLDLAALGIVADLAILQGDTRYLLQRGLEIIRTTPRPGIKAVIEQAEIAQENINEGHIAFELAPRLNSVGRLGDANLGVELLTTSDIGSARLIANQLEVMNNQRRLQTNQVYQAALQQVELEPAILKEPVLIVAHSTWPAGVVGIVASRLVERFGKPAMVISMPEGEPGRGSARSIAGINIAGVLQANADGLLEFGGHPMAAGFSIEPDRILELRRGVGRTLAGMAVPQPPKLLIDAYIHLGEVNLDLVEELERLSPFGIGNPACHLACKNLRIVRSAKVGRNSEHLSVTLVDGSGATARAIWWQGDDTVLPQGEFDLAFTVRSTTYRATPELEIEWVDFHTSQDTALEEVPWIGEIVDKRGAPYPLMALKQLLNEDPRLQVWAEGQAHANITQAGLPACTRLELEPGSPVAIWTPPPGPLVFRSTIERVRPNTVYLFCIIDNLDQAEKFLSRLAGMVKYSLTNQSGRVSLARLAANLGELDETVERGLIWLEQRGFVTIASRAGPEVCLTRGGAVNQAESDHLMGEIRRLLDETKAYRAYFSRVQPNFLMLPKPAE